MRNLTEQALQIAATWANHVVIAAMAALAAFMVVAEWRQKPGYALGALLVGIIVGIAAERMNLPDGVVVVVTALAAVTTPGTILYFHNKTLMDVLEDLKNRGKK